MGAGCARATAARGAGRPGVARPQSMTKEQLQQLGDAVRKRQQQKTLNPLAAGAAAAPSGARLSLRLVTWNSGNARPPARYGTQRGFVGAGRDSPLRAHGARRLAIGTEPLVPNEQSRITGLDTHKRRSGIRTYLLATLSPRRFATSPHHRLATSPLHLAVGV